VRLVAVWGITIDWLSVGDFEDAADTVVTRTDGTIGYGTVNRVYLIGKFEITNGQYAEFINAATATDSRNLLDRCRANRGIGG